MAGNPEEYAPEVEWVEEEIEIIEGDAGNDSLLELDRAPSRKGVLCLCSYCVFLSYL